MHVTLGACGGVSVSVRVCVFFPVYVCVMGGVLRDYLRTGRGVEV